MLSSFLSKSIVSLARFIPLKNCINYYKIAPEALENVMHMELYVRKIKLDLKIKELVKLLASQINGCLFCINMHTKGAKKQKATEEEIAQLRQRETSSLCDEEQKLAFELTTTVTNISERGVPEDVYNRTVVHCGTKGCID